MFDVVGLMMDVGPLAQLMFLITFFGLLTQLILGVGTRWARAAGPMLFLIPLLLAVIGAMTTWLGLSTMAQAIALASPDLHGVLALAGRSAAFAAVTLSTMLGALLLAEGAAVVSVAGVLSKASRRTPGLGWILAAAAAGMLAWAAGTASWTAALHAMATQPAGTDVAAAGLPIGWIVVSALLFAFALVKAVRGTRGAEENRPSIGGSLVALFMALVVLASPVLGFLALASIDG